MNPTFVTATNSPTIQGNFGPLASGLGILNPVPKPTGGSPSVITPKPAQSAINTIQGNTNTINTAVQDQNQNNLLTESAQQNAKLNAATQATNQVNQDQQNQNNTNTSFSLNNATKALTGTTDTNQPVTTPTDFSGKISANLSEADKAYNEFNDQINQLKTGTFPLTTSQLTLLNTVSQVYNQQIASQRITNQNLQGGVTASNITTGLQRYAPNAAASNIAAAVRQGNMAIAQIEATASQALAKLQEGFQTNDLNLINDSYNALSKSLNDKTAVLQKMQDTAITEAKNAQDKIYQDTTTQLESDKFSWQQKQDAFNNLIAQENLTEKQKTDAATIMHEQTQDAIAQADLKIKQATFNLTYGQFLDSNGNQITNTNGSPFTPTQIPGVKQVGNNYYFDPNQISDSGQRTAAENMARRAGINIIDPSETGAVNGLATAVSQMDKLMQAWQAFQSSPAGSAQKQQAALNYESIKGALVSGIPSTFGDKFNKTLPGTGFGSLFNPNTQNPDTAFNSARGVLYTALKTYMPNANFPASGDTMFSSTSDMLKAHPNLTSQATSLAQQLAHDHPDWTPDQIDQSVLVTLNN